MDNSWLIRSRTDDPIYLSFFKMGSIIEVRLGPKYLRDGRPNTPFPKCHSTACFLLALAFAASACSTLTSDRLIVPENTTKPLPSTIKFQVILL